MKTTSKENIFLKLSFYLSFTILVFSLIAVIHYLPRLQIKSKVVDEQSQKIKIIRVIDGDTVVTQDNQKIRLIGIDTPEININNPQKCLGDLATIKMKELLQDRYVTLEKDISHTDQYNRLLRYIWVDNQLINEVLLQQGYAQIETINPDTKYQHRLSAAQTQAKNQHLGLWDESNCSKTNPRR